MTTLLFEDGSFCEVGGPSLEFNGPWPTAGPLYRPTPLAGASRRRFSMDSLIPCWGPIGRVGGGFNQGGIKLAWMR